MSFFKAVEFKVGALVVVVGSLIAFMSLQVTDDPTMLSGSRAAWFIMPDAAGLIKNSAVRSAGIPVGTIKKISLQDGKARIDISIRSDVPLTTSASVQVKANGILGDKYVEIYPGSPTDPPLDAGAQILVVNEKGSLDNLIVQVSEVTSSLKAVADSLREAVSEDGTRKHTLGRIVNNIENLTSDLAEITSQNKGKIGHILERVEEISRTIDETLNDPSDEGFKKTWKRTLARVDSTLKNVDEVAAKVNRGEGTIGKLINDDTTVEELNTAIQGVSSMLDSAGRISTAFDFHGDHMSSLGMTKSYIGIRIQPGLDRFYELGIIDDPAGVVEKQTTKTSLNGGPETVEDSEKIFKNKTKFTLLFGKNFWDWTLKGGLIENSGGFGVDYHVIPKHLQLSLEAFNFAQTNLRAYARVNLPYGFYFLGGVNDAMDKNSTRSGYLGAGLFLTNDDLKLLLTKAPF